MAPVTLPSVSEARLPSGPRGIPEAGPLELAHPRPSDSGNKAPPTKRSLVSPTAAPQRTTWSVAQQASIDRRKAPVKRHDARRVRRTSVPPESTMMAAPYAATPTGTSAVLDGSVGVVVALASSALVDTSAALNPCADEEHAAAVTLTAPALMTRR